MAAPSTFGSRLVINSAGRLLIISNYNATTAVTIASSGGYVNTLLGSIIPLVPIFIPYVALLLLLFRQFILSALTFVFAAFIAPTALTLPISQSLAAEEYYVLDRIEANRETTLVVAILILIIAFLYFQSLVEALATLLLVTVAVALFYAPVIHDLSCQVRFNQPIPVSELLAFHSSMIRIRQYITLIDFCLLLSIIWCSSL